MKLPSSNGEYLVVIASALAIELSQSRSEDELLTLAAFFDVLGDNLALISTQRARYSSKNT